MDFFFEILHGLRRYELKRASSIPVLGVEWKQRDRKCFDRRFYLCLSFFLSLLDAFPAGPGFLQGRGVPSDIKYSGATCTSGGQPRELVGRFSSRGISANSAARLLAQGRHGRG